MVKAFKTLMFVSITLCGINSFGQNTYYVSPSGSNSNDGSQGAPWQTIQYALDQMVPSDELDVQYGVYHEKINIPVDSISIIAEPNHKPIIDATGITTQNAIININSKKQINIMGLELRNNIQNDAQGILIDGTSSDIWIGYCFIHEIHFSSHPNAAVSDTTNAHGIVVYG